MPADTLGPVLDAISGNLSGFGTLVGLLFGFRWLRRGAAVGVAMKMAGYFLGFLAALVVLGVVPTINLAPLVELLEALLALLGDLAGALA